MDELHAVLRETLEAKGTMSRLRASIRAEVFGALADENERAPKPVRENVIINEMIREYLEFNHYDHTLSVFMPESGQPKGAIDRHYLSQQTGLHAQGVAGGADGRSVVQVPLLYSLLSSARQQQGDSRECEPTTVTFEGAARMPAQEDAALAARYRQSGETSDDDEPIPGVSTRVSSIGRSARGAQMPRALGGGAPDPMVFSR